MPNSLVKFLYRYMCIVLEIYLDKNIYAINVLILPNSSDSYKPTFQLL
jgi:hypothetical protein